jgi:phage tail-like protein
MNVNGATFDLILGVGDWGRCLEGDGGDAATLGSRWGTDGEGSSPPDEAMSPPASGDLPAWDGDRSELTLQPLAIELPRTPGESALAIEARRGAAADRYGNVYRVGDDRHSLVVFSTGSQAETVFWPAGPSDCAPERTRLDFQPVATSRAPAVETYFALAVTADDYLVVAFESGLQHGLLSFDLLAGGPPVETLWPLASFHPFDMAARAGGGVWLLERETEQSGAVRNRLWELDCKLAVVVGAQPATTLAPADRDDFQPLSGPSRERPAVTFPGAVDLGLLGTLDAISVEGLGPGVALVLERDALRQGRVWRLERTTAGWNGTPSHWLTELPDPAHDFVLGSARRFGDAAPSAQVFIATQSGNQARAYALPEPSEAFDPKAASELFPLRRFGGRALLAILGQAYYDSGIASPVWTPIVQQPRTLFQNSARLVTFHFDSHELGTVWDRVTLDGCLPPGTTVTIESRAGDELDRSGTAQVVAAWRLEPPPHLRADGPEVPWLRAEAARATRQASGRGTWELLLQSAKGRYLQLRITLASGNGIATPRLRALRAWSPRFSYPKRFLPAVYREDSTSGLFLERWLANFESTFTNIEDKIATLQRLFDPRTVPSENLAWLAGWFDLALDPDWDDRRRRLFVQRAMDFFQWRGTAYGLRLALELTFDECFDEAMFDGPSALPDRPQSIRIVETYQTRSVSGIAPGEGLRDRLAQVLLSAPALAGLAPFPLVPPDSQKQPDLAKAWLAFCGSTLGFVPSIGAQERSLWERFLSMRYADDATEVNKAYGTAYASIDQIPLPRDLPPEAPQKLRDDWSAFCARADGAQMRASWHDFLARRYRRVDRLNRAWETSWDAFDVVAFPDALPQSEAAQNDWLQFERDRLAIQRTAHRFSVLLPVSDVSFDPFEMETRTGRARRVVDLEKPAHTVYDVRFYWALFRVGEARLEVDTLLGQGSRAPELIPAAVLGKTYIGASFVGGAGRPPRGDRLLIAC